MPGFSRPFSENIKDLIEPDSALVLNQDGKLSLEIDEKFFSFENVDSDPEEELVLKEVDGGNF